MWNSKHFIVKRISTVMMGILILAVLLLSSFYIAAESSHDCSGTDCPVCACIQQCETILHRSGMKQVYKLLLSLSPFFICYANFLKMI